MTRNQKCYLLAGLSGAHIRTAEKYLRGEPVKGGNLRERLDRAARQIDRMADQEAATDGKGLSVDNPSPLAA